MRDQPARGWELNHHQRSDLRKVLLIFGDIEYILAYRIVLVFGLFTTDSKYKIDWIPSKYYVL